MDDLGQKDKIEKERDIIVASQSIETAGVAGDSPIQAPPQSNSQADLIRGHICIDLILTNDKSGRGWLIARPPRDRRPPQLLEPEPLHLDCIQQLQSSRPRTATGRRNVWIMTTHVYRSGTTGRRTTGAGLRYEALHHSPRTNWNTMTATYFLINLELVYRLAEVAK